MGQMMQWDEVVKTFPDEWVAFVDYRASGAREIDGVVVVHHRDRKQFHEAVGELFSQYHDMALRFTGTRIQDDTLPLLWQISPIR